MELIRYFSLYNIKKYYLYDLYLAFITCLKNGQCLFLYYKKFQLFFSSLQYEMTSKQSNMAANDFVKHEP